MESALAGDIRPLPIPSTETPKRGRLVGAANGDPQRTGRRRRQGRAGRNFAMPGAGRRCRAPDVLAKDNRAARDRDGAGPPPDLSPEGGGAQTVRTGLSGIIVVGRRGGSPPFSLLPPGRGEVGRGVDPGSADRTGGIPAVSAPPPPDPPRGLDSGNGGPPAAARPVRQRGTPLPTSPLKGGRREEKGGGKKTARPAFPFGHREHPPTGNPDSSPLPGGGAKTEPRLRSPWRGPGASVESGRPSA